MSSIPPRSYIPPNGAYGRPPTPDRLRDDNDPSSPRWRPPSLSTSHILIGLLVLLLLVALTSNVLRKAADGPDVAILTPDQGGEVSAGRILVRLRVAVDDLERWTLFYSGPSTSGSWREVVSDRNGVYPNSRLGTPELRIDEPGAYQLRLVAVNTEGSETEDSVDFTVTP